MRRFCLPFLLCLLAVAPAHANPRFGKGFGVNVKNERMTEAEIEKIAALGIQSVRITLQWDRIESKRGHYDWDRTLPGWWRKGDPEDWPDYSYDRLIENLRDHNLHVAVVLMHGNRIYTGKLAELKDFDGGVTRVPAAPRDAAAINGFARFAAATAAHYSEKYGAENFTWLVWNEPESDPGYPPHVNAAAYGDLLARSCKAIKQEIPAARVMGPALGAYGEGDMRHDFVRGMFARANPLRCLDAFTIHPYRPFAPETAPDDYRKMRRTLMPWQPKRQVPIAVDEWGYSNNKMSKKDISETEEWRDFSGEEQAALVLRSYLTNLAAGIPLTILYEWRDSGETRAEYEHNFGLLDYKGEDKPAMRMMRHVWPLLAGRELQTVLRGRGCGDDAHFHLFGPRAGDADPVLVAWSSGKNMRVSLRHARSMQDMFGEALKSSGKDGTTLTGQPILAALQPGRMPTPVCD